MLINFIGAVFNFGCFVAALVVTAWGELRK
jgi:hypothetical protein